MTSPKLSVEDALAQMAAQVQKGDFAEAASTGNRASVPLGIAKAEFNITSTIFTGQQGSVLHGTYKGQPVAVKRARISTGQDLDNFRKEVYLMSRVKHPNVVQLLAGRVLPPDYMLVMALEGDSLAARLHQQGWRPGWMQIARIALDLASGLAGIQAAGIFHRDIKASNVLIGKDGTAKIGDFGIAELAKDLQVEQADRANLIGRGKPSGGFHKRHLVGTLEYMAPEVLLKEPTSAASDVYSWAVTVNELATGVFPFSDCTKENPRCQTILNFGYGRQELAAAVAAEGLRPIMALDTPAKLAALLEAAWQLRPETRPAAADLEAALRLLVAEMEAAPKPHAETALQNGFISNEHPAEEPVAGSGQKAQNGAVVSSGNGLNAEAKSGSARWMGDSSQGYHPTVTAGAFETAGLRGDDNMEDFHFIACPFTDAGPHSHLMGIFDGHRGRAAASFAAEHFPAHLLRQLRGSRSTEDALRAAFLSLDEAFREQQEAEWKERQSRMGAAAGERPWPGCTAIVIFLYGSRLYVANAGDCRAVLCRGGRAEVLSTDHTADREDERQRIISAGGNVQYRMDSWRIGKAGIQVSRSLGDFDVKAEGLTEEPEVTVTQLDEDDYFLVAASDGLWDKIDNTEAINIINDTVKEPSMCAKRLATEALTRGSADNITATLAFLRPVSTLEKIYDQGKQKYAPHQMFLQPGARRVPTKKPSAQMHAASADELRDTY